MNRKNQLSKEFLEEEYTKKSRTAKDIGDQVGLSEHTILCRLRYYDIPVKKHGYRRFRDLTGQTFGQYTVLERGQSKSRCTYWKCRCLCGNTKLVQAGHLITGQAKQCMKCAGRKKTRGFKNIKGWYINRITSRAHLKGLRYKVSPKYLYDIFIKQHGLCAISGLPISISTTQRLENTTASLDRIDPNKGYVKNNVQWVHKDINKMKWILQEEKFLDYVKKIYEYRRLG